MPGAFDELHHQNAHALAYRAKCRAKRASGFSLTGSGVNDEQSLFFRHQNPIQSYELLAKRKEVCGLTAETSRAAR
jgi:hypothetical protein